MQWEAERDELVRHIHDAGERLARLQAQIESAWAARTPVLNQDAFLSVIDVFRPPSTFRPVSRFMTELDESKASKRANAKEEKHRIAILRTLSLVSKELLDPARKWLYHDLRAGLNLPHASKQLVRTLLESPHLGTLVKRLHLSPDGWQVWGYLNTMPNVETLWVTRRRDSKTHEILSFGKLREVLFLGPNLFDGSHWPEAYTAWPHLSTLTFHHPHMPGQQLLSNSTSKLDLVFPSLSALVFHSADLRSLSVPRCAANVLHTLILHDVALREPLNEILLRQSHSLRHLEVVSTPSLGSPLIISRLENLSHFVFVGHSVTLEDPLNFPTTLTSARFEWKNCTPAKALEFALQRAPALNSSATDHRFLITGVHHWGSRHGAEWMGAIQMAQNVGVTLLLDDFTLEVPSTRRGNGGRGWVAALPTAG